MDSFFIGNQHEQLAIVNVYGNVHLLMQNCTFSNNYSLGKGAVFRAEGAISA